MKTGQRAIHSLSVLHRDLEESLDAAGFRYVEYHLPLVKARLQNGHTVEEPRQLPSSCTSAADTPRFEIAGMKPDLYRAKHTRVVLCLEKLTLGGCLCKHKSYFTRI